MENKKRAELGAILGSNGLFLALFGVYLTVGSWNLEAPNSMMFLALLLDVVGASFLLLAYMLLRNIPDEVFPHDL